MPVGKAAVLRDGARFGSQFAVGRKTSSRFDKSNRGQGIRSWQVKRDVALILLGCCSGIFKGKLRVLAQRLELSIFTGHGDEKLRAALGNPYLKSGQDVVEMGFSPPVRGPYFANL